MKIKKIIKYQLMEMAVVTAYFYIAFSFVILVKMLILAQYNIEFDRIIGALGSALIMGKVILVLDSIRLPKLFNSRRMIIGVLFRTIVYSLVADILVLLEYAYHLYMDGEVSGNTIIYALKHVDVHQMWFIMLSSFVVLLNYNLFLSLGSYFGAKSLFKLFLNANQRSAT